MLKTAIFMAPAETFFRITIAYWLNITGYKMMAFYLKQIVKQLKLSAHSFNPVYLLLDYSKWRDSNHDKKRSPLKDGVPWVNYASLRFISRLLKPEMIGFEYGCGGSSVFFSKRVKHLTSVDHEPQWFELTKA